MSISSTIDFEFAACSGKRTVWEAMRILRSFFKLKKVRNILMATYTSRCRGFLTIRRELPESHPCPNVPQGGAVPDNRNPSWGRRGGICGINSVRSRWSFEGYGGRLLGANV